MLQLDNSKEKQSPFEICAATRVRYGKWKQTFQTNKKRNIVDHHGSPGSPYSPVAVKQISLQFSGKCYRTRTVTLLKETTTEPNG